MSICRAERATQKSPTMTLVSIGLVSCRDQGYSKGTYFDFLMHKHQLRQHCVFCIASGFSFYLINEPQLKIVNSIHSQISDLVSNSGLYMYWVTAPLPNTLLPLDGVICHVTDSVSEKNPLCSMFSGPDAKQKSDWNALHLHLLMIQYNFLG